jgi:hypothetical protein
MIGNNTSQCAIHHGHIHIRYLKLLQSAAVLKVHNAFNTTV